MFSRGSLCHGTIKSEGKNLVEKLRGDNIFKNTARQNNSEVESWAQKFCKLESQRIDSKLESKIFRLDSRWSESHWIKSNHSRRFEKYCINLWFIWYSCHRKGIDIAGTVYCTHFTNIYLWEYKWPSVTTAWIISRKCDT